MTKYTIDAVRDGKLSVTTGSNSYKEALRIARSILREGDSLKFGRRCHCVVSRGSALTMLSSPDWRGAVRVERVGE